MASLSSRSGMRRGTTALSIAVVVAVLTLPVTGARAATGTLGPPKALKTTVSAAHGSGSIDAGEACSEGGDGGSWHYDYEAPLPSGVITGATNPLPGSVRLHVDLHSEDHIVRASPGEPQPGRAWLQGTESAVTLANQRGTVTMQLRSDAGKDGATCATARTLTFDGAQATGANLPWEVSHTTGSYRQAAGSGNATLAAGVGPGADNPFNLSLDGTIAVLQAGYTVPVPPPPTPPPLCSEHRCLKLEVLDTYWAFLGAHYLKRWVTAIYRVTNDDPNRGEAKAQDVVGDAFGVTLEGAISPTDGVELVDPILVDPIPSDTSTNNLGFVPQHLGDLGAGDSEIVRLRWELPVPSGDPPCGLVILGCEFDTVLEFKVHDALDVVQTFKTEPVRVKAPDFPPPVVD